MNRSDHSKLLAACGLVIGVALACSNAQSTPATTTTASAAAASPGWTVPDSVTGQLGEWGYVARFTRSADSLRARLILRNSGVGPADLEWGACSLDLVLYAPGDSARRGPSVYRARQAWGGEAADGVRRMCPLYAVSATVAPGDTLAAREFEITAGNRGQMLNKLTVARYPAFLALHHQGFRNSRLWQDTLWMPIGDYVARRGP